MAGLKTLGIVVSCFMLLVSVAAADGSWELIKSEDGIDTYRMTHPGTDVCTFKGVGFIDAKMEVVGCVIRDIPSYPEWMADCTDTQIIQTIDRNTYIFRNVINVPLPYQDRDMVIKNRTFYLLENGTARITFDIPPDGFCPERKGYYRLYAGQLEGMYYLEFFGRDKTRVTYLHKADPGGNIPVVLANILKLRHYPAINIQGLRRMVQKEKYIQAGLESPDFELIESMLADKSQVGNVLRKRIGEYVTDPVLLGMMFDTTMADRIVTHVHENRATFDSVRQGVIDLLNIMAAEGLEGDLRAEVHGILEYLADKRFEDFFAMEKFMQERWLVDEIAREKQLIDGLLNRNSDLARIIFEKITASESAVASFIKDRDLAHKIVHDPSIREKLWRDEILRARIIEDIGAFESLKEFESLVAGRVKSYQ